MESIDLMKHLTARAIANGVDEARAEKVAADLAPLLSHILHADDELLRTAEPATLFQADAAHRMMFATTRGPDNA